MSSDSTRWPDGGFAPGAVLRAREQWRRDAPPPTRPSRRAAAIRARPRRGGGCKILHRGAKFLIPATSGVRIRYCRRRLNDGNLRRRGCSTWCSTVVLHSHFRRLEKCPVLLGSCTFDRPGGESGLRTPLIGGQGVWGPTRRGLGTPRLPVGAAQPTSPIFSNDRFAPIVLKKSPA